MATFYNLHVEKDQIAGTLPLNGVPLSEWHDTKPAAAAHAVNSWIQGRSNRLSSVPSWTSVSSSPRVEIAITATVAPDQVSTQGTRVAEFRWPTNPAAMDGPPAIEFDFQVADPPPGDLWPRLLPLDLNEQARPGVLALLGQLNEALASRDVGWAAALLDFKAQDIGRAMYFAPDAARQSQQDFLSFFTDDQGSRWSR